MSKKKYAIILIFIALLAVSIIAFYMSQPRPDEIGVGVKVGDKFTYQVVDYVDALADVSLSEFSTGLNKTNCCTIEITNVESSLVSYTGTIQFRNGTIFSYDNVINIETGISPYAGGFFGIYAANLTIGHLSRPGYSEGVAIDDTLTRTYIDGDRQTNFFHVEDEFYDTDDPNFYRSCYVFTYVHFDRQIGILVELKEMSIFNDPQITLTTEWKLVDSNVLQIPP